MPPGDTLLHKDTSASATAKLVVRFEERIRTFVRRSGWIINADLDLDFARFAGFLPSFIGDITRVAARGLVTIVLILCHGTDPFATAALHNDLIFFE
jgi:hypothetical protein